MVARSWRRWMASMMAWRFDPRPEIRTARRGRRFHRGRAYFKKLRSTLRPLGKNCNASSPTRDGTLFAAAPAHWRSQTSVRNWGFSVPCHEPRSTTWANSSRVRSILTFVKILRPSGRGAADPAAEFLRHAKSLSSGALARDRRAAVTLHALVHGHPGHPLANRQ